MKSVRYYLLVLLALVPALAAAQPPGVPDSVVVTVEGMAYGAYVATTTPPINRPIGPLPLVAAEPFDACDASGPLQNLDELDGSIALVTRGACTFTEKIENLASAGAEAVVIANNDMDNPDELFVIGGTPPMPVVPAVSVSYNSGQALLDALLFGPTDATIRPSLPCGLVSHFLSTDVVLTTIFSDGFIGDTPSAFICPPGFEFMGENGLAVGSVLLGQVSGPDTTVIGSPYVYEPEYTATAPIRSLSPPFEPPFEEFDEGLEVVFVSEDLGVEITERASARDADAFIVFDLHAENTTDSTLTGLYVGLFADFAVGDGEQNLGGFDAGTHLVYAYAPSSTSTSYFGMAALAVDEVAGWTLATDEDAADGSLYRGLTTPGAPLAEPQDVRAVVGVGPLDLAAGEAATARFALVAGADEAAILTNAAAAQSLFPVAAEAAPLEGIVVLGPVYPNPLSRSATVSLTLVEAQRATLTVYDVLGRRVATLHDGLLAAGHHRFALAAAELPSGVYLVRANAGAFAASQRLTVAR